jgi:hypothetical protein
LIGREADNKSTALARGKMNDINIFVGSLTRYYSAAWDTELTRLAKSRGEPYQLFAVQTGVSELNPNVIEPAVLRWRKEFCAAVANHAPSPLTWQEGMDAPWAAIGLGRRGYNGIVLAAAYAQQPTMMHPVAYVDDCREDPAVIACQGRRTEAPIFNIVCSSLWLPGNFSYGTQYVDPPGRATLQIGSLGLLKKALDAINDVKLQAGDSDIAQWASGDRLADQTFEAQMRFGFAAFYLGCQLAIDRKLPLKLHF